MLRKENNICTIYFDLQKAQRDKSKLVYVQRTVTKNGKTFQQGFWVHPSQVKSTDIVLKNQGALNAYQTAQKTAQQQSSVVGNFDKSKYTVLYTTESKAKAMQYAKDNGITWNEHSNPNINWMRCQMAVNKALGGSVTVSTSNSASSATLDVSNLSSNFNSLSKKDKVVELLKHNSRDSLKVKNNEELDAVLANLQFIVASNYTCSTTQRQNGYKTRPSKANDNGNALSKTFNYYARKNFQDWQSLSIQERNLSIDDANKAVDAQLNNVPTFSKKWFDNAKEYANKYGNENFKGASWDDDPSTESQKKQAKAFSIDFGSYSNITGYMGTPVGDLLTKQIATLAKYCPQMETARFNTPEKIQKQVEDKIGYKPFEIEPPQTSSGSTTNIPELRKLREELYSKVHCSLKSCDSATYDNIQTKIKQDWDMGKRSSSGSRLYGHISAVFKGAYKVNNSLQEEKMLENAKKLGETPQDFFHGTNHSGATGIIGVDGRFRAPKSSADASKQGLKYAGGMLGSGVYLAKMAGKSAGYFGTWGQSYEPEGCMLMCKAVLGNTYVSSGFNSSAPASYDTVSMQAGTNTGRTILRADEWCVRNPDFVYPEYIVDMGTKRRV